MAESDVRFVQIIAATPGASAWLGPAGTPQSATSPMTPIGLYALDSAGIVWAYLGHKWVSLGGRPDGT